MAVGVCAYWGETKPLTVDHVPPKLMLEEPYPDNLVTVPACLDCNKRFQKNQRVHANRHSARLPGCRESGGAVTFAEIFRSLAYPQAKGFSDYLKRQLKATDLVDGTGKPLRNQGVEVDHRESTQRASCSRRGLFFAWFVSRCLAILRCGCIESWDTTQSTSSCRISTPFLEVGGVVTGKVRFGPGFSFVAGRSVDGRVFGFLLFGSTSGGSWQSSMGRENRPA